MVKRRPHILEVTVQQTGGYDDDGVFIEGSPSTLSIPCRIQSAPRQNVMVDGNARNVSFSIYVDKTDFSLVDIPENSKCKVDGHEYEIVKIESFQTYDLIWA